MIDVASSEGRERLTAALALPRWVDEVAGGGPYPSVDALVAAGDAADARLTDEEMAEAVSHHPRIGEHTSGDGTAVRLAAHERAGLGSREDGVDAAIARGNEVYEQRFGRVFLIRAEGRSDQQVLDELQRRLKNSPEDEAEETKDQLREIAALRLRSLFGDGG